MDRSTIRNAGATGTVFLGTLMTGGAAMAAPVTPVQGPDYSQGIQNAVTQGTAVLTDNVLLLMAIPALWVGYKVARKVIAKVG